jgi:hypothetical protein
VPHISWQNNYVRIGPVTEAVLSAIVFVSMIADGPMEMAFIVSDPQQTGDGSTMSVENQAAFQSS